jgi:hypothetical protein
MSLYTPAASLKKPAGPQKKSEVVIENISKAMETSAESYSRILQ